VSNGRIEGVICHRLTLIALAALLLAIPFKWHCGKVFFGLEYEDAYIFSVAGRLLSFGNFGSLEHFIVAAPTIGSMSQPEVVQSYSGHLGGFPAILALLYRLLGYSTALACNANVCATLLVIPIIVRFSWVLFRSLGVAASAVAIYVFAPAINVFQGTALCEPTSALFVIGVIWLSAEWCSGEHTASWRIVISALCGFLLLIACSIKRENVLLVIVPFAAVSIEALIARSVKESLARGWPMLLGGVFSLMLAAFVFDVGGTALSEEAEFGAPAFSWSYFPRLGGALLHSLAQPCYFGIVAIFLLAGAVLVPWHSIRLGVWLPWLFSLALYSVAYLTHCRSYYFAAGETVRGLELFRYVSNVYPLLCPLGGYALWKVICRLGRQKRDRAFGTIVLTFVLIMTLFQTLRLRKAWSHEEERLRIIPALNVMRSLPPSSVLITAEPVIFQFLGAIDLKIIGLAALNARHQRAVAEHLMKNNVAFYFTQDDYESPVNAKRYAEALAWIRRLSIVGHVPIPSADIGSVLQVKAGR
jgi:hypothetical protein